MRVPAYLTTSRHGVFYFRWPLPKSDHPRHKTSDIKLSLDKHGLVFHSFRHTMITNLLQSGVAEPLTKSIVGHAQEGVTQTVYFREGVHSRPETRSIGGVAMEIIVWGIIAAGAWYLWSRWKRQASPDHGQLMKNSTAELGVVKDKTLQFTVVTYDWIRANFGPLETLPKDTITALAMYMSDATYAACKYAGLKTEIHKYCCFGQLVAMGYREEEADGMMAAMSTSATALGTDLGGSAFNAWIREGDTAAQDHIRDAMTTWESSSHIYDEITAYGRPSDSPTINEPNYSEALDFGYKVANALSDQILLFAPNGVFPERAKDSWSIGYIIGFTDAMLQSHGDIERHNWGGVEISVLLRLYGEEQGRVSIDKYYNSFADGNCSIDDTSLREGMMIGEEDIARCLADDVAEGYEPIRWGAYVNEQSMVTA